MEMRLPEAIRTLKANTMACWWPDYHTFPGKRGTDWDGIFGEVWALLDGIKERQGIEAGAMFYTLDDSDPETATHDELMAAMMTVRRAAGVS